MFISGPTGNRARISATPGRCRSVGPSARIMSGPDRSRTDHTDLARISRHHRHAGPSFREVRPGIEPGLRPYHRRVQPEHLQTIFKSDRGWNRTIDLLVVTQASLPLDHAIVSDRGGRRTHKIATLRAPTLRWSVTALPICVPGRFQKNGGSGGRTRRSKLMRLR